MGVMSDDAKPTLDEALDSIEEMLESYEMVNAHLNDPARGTFLAHTRGPKNRALATLKRAGRTWPKKGKST